MRFWFILFVAAVTGTPSLATEKAWVCSDRLNRRTCPGTHCGVVGQFFHREGVTIYEEKSGWARVSKYYDASCLDGRSQSVDFGNPSCSSQNGINNGKFSEWVSLKYLATTRPPDPGSTITGIAEMISASDDFTKYKSAFVKASNKLMVSGRCTTNDFQNTGGWIKSTTTYHDQPVYFTYCGAMKRSNRIYLNASNGRIFQ